MLTALKIIVSGVAIGGINLLAHERPQLAGWIAALPLVTFLSVVWLMVDQKDNREIAIFIKGVLYGLLPLAAILWAMIALLERGVPPSVAIGAGVALWALFTFAAARLGFLGI